MAVIVMDLHINESEQLNFMNLFCFLIVQLCYVLLSAFYLVEKVMLATNVRPSNLIMQLSGCRMSSRCFNFTLCVYGYCTQLQIEYVQCQL
jgi:hypothetical protein